MPEDQNTETIKSVIALDSNLKVEQLPPTLYGAVKEWMTTESGMSVKRIKDWLHQQGHSEITTLDLNLFAQKLAGISTYMKDVQFVESLGEELKKTGYTATDLITNLLTAKVLKHLSDTKDREEDSRELGSLVVSVTQYLKALQANDEYNFKTGKLHKKVAGQVMTDVVGQIETSLKGHPELYKQVMAIINANKPVVVKKTKTKGLIEQHTGNTD
jgi:hypothetical protein